MDQSMPGPPFFHCLLELAQIHVGCFDDTVQPSRPLSFAFTLSQHQGLFQGVFSCWLWVLRDPLKGSWGCAVVWPCLVTLRPPLSSGSREPWSGICPCGLDGIVIPGGWPSTNCWWVMVGIQRHWPSRYSGSIPNAGPEKAAAVTNKVVSFSSKRMTVCYVIVYATWPRSAQPQANAIDLVRICELCMWNNPQTQTIYYYEAVRLAIKLTGVWIIC